MLPGCHCGGHQVFEQQYQHLLARAAVTGAAMPDRDVRADVECLAHLVLVVDVRAVYRYRPPGVSVYWAV